MTRSLYLLRHAKSDWSDPDMPDHERMLAPRGLRAAKLMAAHLKKLGLKVDRIYASTARRARETVHLVRPSVGNAPLTYRRSLYLISGDGLTSFIQGLPDRHCSVMIVAHDPGLHEAAVALLAAAQKGKRKEAARVRAKFPTGALLGITFDAETWAEVRPGFGRLAMFIRPRDLGGRD
jgi:phosphohistidine phosphatase